MASAVGSAAPLSIHSCLQRPRRVCLHGQALLRRSVPLVPPPSRLAQRAWPNLRVLASAAVSSTSPTAGRAAPFSSHAATFLADSTRTVASLAVLAMALSKLFASSAQSLAAKVVSAATVRELAGIREVGRRLASATGPLFFAALRDRPQGDLNTPLTVVAAGLARWLEIYSGVLMIRVLLSWFPNIPWDRQPLSAIRDLCDPYLNLFRNIIPPIFDALDVSPLLAFAVLGTLSSILNSSKGGY
ncbi:hypothetical protein Taro_017889 [Colocasia esculenta]|uniref:Uncharacterized protein n=1 Tax=Colocasia esculenta TaxID=4460 RepID=A0A843V0Q5_COLES|nr:hypothetical protein [Colocasia esculenta]